MEASDGTQSGRSEDHNQTTPNLVNSNTTRGITFPFRQLHHCPSSKHGSPSLSLLPNPTGIHVHLQHSHSPHLPPPLRAPLRPRCPTLHVEPERPNLPPENGGGIRHQHPRHHSFSSGRSQEKICSFRSWPFR